MPEHLTKLGKMTRFSIKIATKVHSKKTPDLINIYFRVSLGSERLYFGQIDQPISHKLWDSSKSRVKGKSPLAIEINNEISRIISDITHIYRQLEFSEVLSLTRIKEIYTGKPAQGEVKISFINFFEKYNARIKTEVNILRSKGSFQKHNCLLNHYKSFLYNRFHKTDILVEELTQKHIEAFRYYLLKDKLFKLNTAMKMLANLKSIITAAFVEYNLPNNPFNNIKFTWEPVNRGFLTEVEIKSIMSKEFSTRLNNVKDIFLFACFTGLSYIDVTNLTPDNIVELDGKKWIMTHRHKTKIASNILLLDIAENIINKYANVEKNGKLLPTYSNQKLNEYLKEIAAICGINKNLTFHLARHTFATLALTKGVSIESVSKMLGHNNIKTTQIYAKIINKKVEEEMEMFENKLDFLNN